MLRDLENSMDTGNDERALMLLGRMAEYLSAEGADYEAQSMVLCSLRFILIRKTGIALDDGFLRGNPPQTALGHISDLVVRHCRTVRERLSGENEISAPQIVGYIQDHLSDTELCLSGLSEKFGLSANYISMLIKRQTGRNYSVYITEQRMQLAMHLLEHTDKSIDEIVCAAGYYHKNTFYKVFKRTFGNPPTFYRQSEGVEKSTP